MGPTTLGGPLILLANIRAMQWGPLLLWANIRSMQWGPLLLLKRAYISGNAKFAGRVRVSLSDCIVVLELYFQTGETVIVIILFAN